MFKEEVRGFERRNPRLMEEDCNRQQGDRVAVKRKGDREVKGGRWASSITNYCSRKCKWREEGSSQLQRIKYIHLV
jgi:hypothetical protein